MRDLSICKRYGLNHIRFHSWCPPEAAFEVADELGMYLAIECSSWANASSIGDGKPIDSFVHAEAERIVKAFGNHPSFCFLSYGNEPGGKGSGDYLKEFVTYWKAKDNRRLYTTAAGWPNIPESDYLSDQTPRIQRWGEGLESIINRKEPSTAYDWSSYTSEFNQPFISHEIGQWCVYPNFKEITKYKGVYHAKNFEIFQETLDKNGLGALADSFLIASGKLQTLCYKADLEAAMRTKNFGGYQTLGLNDFPGQGTALVGALDVFWEEKGYTTAEEYRRFCNSVVPLVRMEKLIYENCETFKATVEVANYRKEFMNPDIRWAIKKMNGSVVAQGTFTVNKLIMGNVLSVGEIQLNLTDIVDPHQLKLIISVEDYINDWDFWVYPVVKGTLSDDILLTSQIDKTTIDCLNKGGKVLLSLQKGSLSKDYGGDIAIGFSSIFWNTSWTQGQPPHTLGILCDPNHPALSKFPTEFHSNYQWWDAMNYSGAIRIDKFSAGIQPIVRVIDDWFTNRSLALLFEVKVGNGSLLVSGIDLIQDLENRPAAKQLLYCLKTYMNGEAFCPSNEVTIGEIKDLVK